MISCDTKGHSKKRFPLPFRDRERADLNVRSLVIWLNAYTRNSFTGEHGLPSYPGPVHDGQDAC